MRGGHTIEEQVTQLKEYLDCPCTYFPPMADDQPILDAYRQARARGAKEGFVPMLVAVDELLMECFSLSGQDKAQVRRELLAAPLGSGKEYLQKWLKEIKEERGEYEPGDWDDLVGEVSGGEGIDRFLSLRDFDGKKTVPVVLAEIPVKHPWEVFAWLPFGGWNECPANEDHMAVAKYWFEAYGAVPALMTHDVLEYSLPAPVSREKAIEVAWEQFTYCSDIVEQGVGTVGALADGLAQSTVWYFWWD